MKKEATQYEKEVLKKLYECHKKLMNLIKERGVYNAFKAIEDSGVIDGIYFFVNHILVTTLSHSMSSGDFYKIFGENVSILFCTSSDFGELISFNDEAEVERDFYSRFVRDSGNDPERDGERAVKLDAVSDDVDKFLSAKF